MRGNNEEDSLIYWSYEKVASILGAILYKTNLYMI